MKKKKTTIEDLAILVVNGFDEVKNGINGVKGEVNGLKGEIKGLQEKTDRLGTRMASVEYGQYEIQKKLDGVASSYDLAKMDSKYERRFQKIEAKIGMKQKTK